MAPSENDGIHEGVRASRSPRQVNKIIQENKSAREATEALREYAKDPDYAILITHRAEEGSTPAQINEEISWIRRYAWARSKGYSLASRLKHHWPGLISNRDSMIARLRYRP
jgi:hypothetical protein